MNPPPANPPNPSRLRHPGPPGAIRRRIVISHLGLLGLSLLLSFLVGHRALHNRLEGQVDRELNGQITELETLIRVGVDPSTGQAFDGDMEAVIRKFLSRRVPADDIAYYSLVDGARFETSDRAPVSLFDDSDLVARWAAGGVPDVSSWDSSEGDIRYLAKPLEHDGSAVATFVVVHFMEQDRAELGAALGLQASIGVAVFVLASLIALHLAGRVVQPIEELTSAARTISDDDLSVRFPVRGDDELSAMSRTFNDMLARLERGFTGQRRFLDDVAHELRTPLTIVQGHLDLMDDDPAERAQTMELVQDELNRMERYVNDLLLLAKAETPDFLRLRAIDVGHLAAAIHRTVLPLGKRDWVIDTAPSPGTVSIQADATRLSQAVLNLATNAVHHSEDRSQIGLGFSIRTEADPDDDPGRILRIWVRDQGTGIDPETIDRLFDRNRRGAASRARRWDGHGIGLSIVDAVVRAHGGTVWAENLPGPGARFVIDLPLEPFPSSGQPGGDTEAGPTDESRSLRRTEVAGDGLARIRTVRDENRVASTIGSSAGTEFGAEPGARSGGDR